MDFTFEYDFDNSEAFQNVRRSAEKYFEAHAALKRARRRRRIVRLVKGTLMVAGAVSIYNHVKTETPEEAK